MGIPGAGAKPWGGESPEDFFRRMEAKGSRKPHGTRRPRRRKKPRLPAGTYRGTVADGSDLGQAAQLVADEAARIARGNGMPQTAGSISVEVSGDTAIVYSDAPAAYPNEVPGVRHPTYGHSPWVTNQYRPFLAPAAEAKATAAMKRYAEKLDRLLRKAGFE